MRRRINKDTGEGCVFCRSLSALQELLRTGRWSVRRALRLAVLYLQRPQYPVGMKMWIYGRKCTLTGWHKTYRGVAAIYYEFDHAGFSPSQDLVKFYLERQTYHKKAQVS